MEEEIRVKKVKINNGTNPYEDRGFFRGDEQFLIKKFCLVASLETGM
jgi:hypothetical protein